MTNLPISPFLPSQVKLTTSAADWLNNGSAFMCIGTAFLIFTLHFLILKLSHDTKHMMMMIKQGVLLHQGMSNQLWDCQIFPIKVWIGYMKEGGMMWKRQSPWSLGMLDDIIHVKGVDGAYRLYTKHLVNQSESRLQGSNGWLPTCPTMAISESRIKLLDGLTPVNKN